MQKLEINIKAAVLWQLQHLVKNLTTGKFLSAAQSETEKMFEKTNGEDYRKHLIKFLFREIDFQSKRQTETAKLNLLRPNLIAAMQSPYFLTSDVFEFMPEITNLMENHLEILRHLKLKTSEQLIFCLGIYTYGMQNYEVRSVKILKNKVKEWFEYEKDGQLPSYAVFALLNAMKKEPEFSEDPTFRSNIREYMIQQNLKVFKEDSMHAAKVTSIFD